MKRFMTVSIAFVFTMIVLVGCSPIDSIKNLVAPQAMGVIAYGDESVIKVDIARYQEDLKSSNTYPVKLADNILVLKSSTAQSLFEQEMLRKVVQDSKTEVLTSLPTVTKETGILFAKENGSPLKIGGKEVNAKYEGNVVIGHGRVYGEKFLIVDDSEWEKFVGTDKMMGVLAFDKKNPKHELTNFSAERVQLVDLK
ncbi:lipoprotein BA_5634 family protein [Paenibacillus guangzhouensis]|uniref:lipoprotein BA_5634 family protein n=1 Tax=Paenibacillus guangzhouensis TaxID=1473112 RepID=UPI0012673148|nr:lipoprotein BA_5634 family protein [Paenibacillus guangzhouensis]